MVTVVMAIVRMLAIRCVGDSDSDGDDNDGGGVTLMRVMPLAQTPLLSFRMMHHCV